MYYKTIVLTENIKDCLIWSKQTVKELTKLTQKKISKYCKTHKLRRRDIDFNIEYVANITIKIKAIEHDNQIDLMDLLKKEKEEQNGINNGTNQ